MRRLHESEEAELAQYEAELKAKYGSRKRMEHNGREFTLIGESRPGRVSVIWEWDGTVREVDCDLYDAVDMADAEPWLVWVWDGRIQSAVTAEWYNSHKG